MIQDHEFEVSVEKSLIILKEAVARLESALIGDPYSVEKKGIVQLVAQLKTDQDMIKNELTQIAHRLGEIENRKESPMSALISSPWSMAVVGFTVITLITLLVVAVRSDADPPKVPQILAPWQNKDK